jgi:prepilin-type N-terminal cleavage/methylation domain-containing protein
MKRHNPPENIGNFKRGMPFVGAASAAMYFEFAAKAAPTSADRSNGQSMMKRQHGFTMIEMTIVLIMIGILTAALGPLLLSKFNQSTEETDRRALEEAKTAIISYATSFGGVPNPLSMAGINVPLPPLPMNNAGALATCTDAPIVAGGVGMMPWIAPPLFPTTPPPPPNPCTNNIVAEFGVNNWGVFGKEYPFRMDVNDHLKSNYIGAIFTSSVPATYTGTYKNGDKVIFCQAVNEQMQNANAAPFVCQDSASDHVTSACPTASAIPVAFVLYSTGTDRKPNQENNEAGLVAGNPGYRIYENDKRGINNSSGDSHYDDQVMSYPLSALARDCRERMNVLPEVMACAPGQKYVGSVMSSTAGISYTLGVATGLSVVGTTYVNQCFARTDMMKVGTQTGVLGTIDANGDGRVDFVIIDANTFTGQ